MEDAAHGEFGVVFDPLGDGDDVAGEICEAGSGMAEGFGRHGGDDQIGMSDGGGGIEVELPAAREIDAGEEHFVAAGGADLIEALGFEDPQRNGIAAFVEEFGEGGAPGAGAEDGDIHGVEIPGREPRRCSVPSRRRWMLERCL